MKLLDETKIKKWNFRNPKQIRRKSKSWYRYYAGYSEEFVLDALKEIGADEDSVILDPWVGSGTTPYVASNIGIRSIGVDLNPVMVIVAKSRCSTSIQKDAARRIFAQVAGRATQKRGVFSDDPLTTLFHPETAAMIRNFEREIRARENISRRASASYLAERLSEEASLLYTALFNCARDITESLRSSNPTWVKRNAHIKVQVDQLKFMKILTDEVGRLTECTFALFPEANTHTAPMIRCASSKKMPFNGDEISAVITSPPYCTRIDYAVKTAVELAIIGVGSEESLSSTRKKLIGTTLTEKNPRRPKNGYAKKLIEQISLHSSKASNTYYRRYFTKYLRDMEVSISEIARVLKVGGWFISVVQDSYYKELKIDLPEVITQLGADVGLALVAEISYPTRSGFSAVNKWSKLHGVRLPVEKVLVLRK